MKLKKTPTKIDAIVKDLKHHDDKQLDTIANLIKVLFGNK